MSRTRFKKIRTEEEKRNIKVDLRRVTEWERELESIRSHFERFNLSEIVSAASLIQKIREDLYLVDLRHSTEVRQKIDRWKNTLTVDKLISLSTDYSTPDFFTYYGKKVNYSELIHNKLNESDKTHAKYKAAGVTNSFLVSLFTSKVSPELVQSWEQSKACYLSMSREIPKIEEALSLLEQVLVESEKYADKASKIKERLLLAEEKKGAIERYEAKYGNATAKAEKEKKDAIDRFAAKHEKVFAKAAAVDNKTRNRSKNIKGLVEKTNDCPYCGGELGATPHLDHIYPVSKGGLSIIENLVWCCSSCNSLKTDKGLTQFIRERNVPVEQILLRLSNLGKHV